MTVSSIGKVVKDLKRKPGVVSLQIISQQLISSLLCVSQSKRHAVVTDEERMQAAIDRLPSSVRLDTRIEAKKMAVE